jgi:hypothetical protein
MPLRASDAKLISIKEAFEIVKEFIKSEE